MKTKLIIFILPLLFLFSFCNKKIEEPDVPPPVSEVEEEEEDNTNIYDNDVWMSKIRPDHPRLFFNSETFPAVKRRALVEEVIQYNTIKRQADQLMDKDIVFEDPLREDGTGSTDQALGQRAAYAAFVYLVTEDRRYFDLSKRILEKVVEYYQLRNQNKLNISWYASSRLHTLMAYDWLYNDLSEAERKRIGTDLFNAISYMLPSEQRSNFNRENRSGTDTGFYNNQSLEWYLGLLFYGTGINDAKAAEILKTGYESHTEMLDHRSASAGEDGGANSGTLSYALGDNPWAEYNFFHSFIAATGANITTEYNYLPNFVGYLYWNTLPGQLEFGYGDTRHIDNSIAFPIINMHLAQLIYFYGDRFPEHASIAKWMMEEQYPRVQNEPTGYPLARFLLTEGYETTNSFNPANRIPRARYFETMGQFFMRSGSGPNDTYATFTVSHDRVNHRHYDNNNFVIYKNGFMCLDTGTRPDGIHLSHYYARTVAHNAITIRMPGEVLPRYWGSRAPHEPNDPVPNDGGQNSLTGTNAVAFDEKDEYVYIASDATGSYNSLKADLVLRQFVFLAPNNFVVFDRVNSTNAGYPKKWLIHTADHPKQVSDTEFYADHEEGRLICKTIYPENAGLELIGGPGKQFWSDGRNWPLPYGGDENPLYGQWRVEVSPESSQKNDMFLHLIQVGDRSAGATSIPSALKITDTDMVGVKFSYDNKDYEVLFSTVGEAGGKITIRSGGSVILTENFKNTIKPQTGLGLK